MSGYPEYQPIDQAENLAGKRRLLEIMHALIEAPLPELADALRAGYHEAASLHVSHPINAVSGLEALAEQFWRPLRRALPDVERREDILAGGLHRGVHWLGCLGHYVGTFGEDWFGLPPTQGVVAVRFAEGHVLQDGKLARSYIFVDLLDLMRQVGYWPIAPSLGREMQWLAPRTHDGVLLSPQADAVSRVTHELIIRLHTGLDMLDGNALSPETMDLIEQEDARHFHPNFLWYGAAGIGTTRGIRGFSDYHGHPFLTAFPDRGGGEPPHFIRISDGHYAVTGGWGYLQATHTGSDFLGLPASGRHVAMRVMDFYRCNDTTICENWVPIDIPHLLLQMGVDIFGRMRHQFRQTNKLSVRSWLLRA
jgi:predicted ester cyclase